MAATITDTTTSPMTVKAGQTLTPFGNVQVADAIGTTETVTVALGYNYFSYYSPNADFGTLSDPNGGGSYDPTTHVFTEAGLVGGDPTFATQLLKRLVYTPPAVGNGQSNAITARTSVADNGGAPVTDPNTIVIDTVSAPGISGTVSNEPMTATPGNTIKPFATTFVADTNFAYSGKVVATIKLTDGGALTDADGLLTGAGLGKTGNGTYTLSNPISAYQLSNYLQNLVFTPTTPVAAGTNRTTNFELDVTDPDAGLTTTDTITSVLQFGPVAQPLIAGTQAGQTVASGNAIMPFAHVTISDSNANPQDSVTIRLLNSAGTPTDANGTLSGAGLTETAAGSGIYTLAAASPATIAAELNALTFTPTALANGQNPVTTTFELSVADAGQTTTNATTTVTENPAPPPISANFLVTNQTTGQIIGAGGDPYSGTVPGLTRELILVTTDNVNVSSEIKNVFIHTGSGNDAINVSGVNGDNVLDGGTGSNFLTGGTGTDQFYLDDRSPNAPIFSTIVNFHSGDNATVWGVNSTSFTLLELDNQGADGYKGLDFIFSAPGQSATSFVLAGYTSADLSNGRLSMSYGHTPDTNGIPGSDYLTVHAV